MKLPLSASLALLAIAASAQYSLNWSTIEGGGGTSIGGDFTLAGTVGQADARGPMTGGNFSLTGGFWAGVGVVQTPGAPLLSITTTATNTVAVIWPAPAIGWILQQNSGLNTTNWSAVAQTPAIVGTNRVVIINPPVGNRFFRLYKP
jgi:hypothetical protein